MAYVGLQQIIQGVNAELKNKIELEKTAAGTSRTVAGGEAAVAINIGDVEKDVFKGFVGSVHALADKINFPKREELLYAASTTLSATGADRELTLGILEVAGKLSKHQPDELPELAQAVGDFSRLAGFTPEEAMAMIASTMKQSRITGLVEFKNVGQALAAGINNNPNVDPKIAAQETASLFATLSQASSDKDGAITKTAVAALSTTLRKAFEIDNAKYEQLVSEGVSIKDARQQATLTTAQRLFEAQKVGERIEAAINSGQEPSPADTKIMTDLTSAGLRLPQKSVIEGMLRSDDNKDAQYFRRSLAEIGPDIAGLNRIIENYSSGTSNLRLAEMQFSQESAIQRAQMNEQRKAMGTAYEIYEKTLKDTQQFFGSSFGTGVSLQATSSMAENEKTEHMLGILKARRDTLISRDGGDESKVTEKTRSALESIDNATRLIWQADPFKVERQIPDLLDQVFEKTGEGRKLYGSIPFNSQEFDPSSMETSTSGFSSMTTVDDALGWLREREEKIRIGERRAKYSGLEPSQRPDEELAPQEKQDVDFIRDAMEKIKDMQDRNAATGSAAIQAMIHVERV